MDTLSKILLCLKQKNKTQKEMTSFLGFTNSTFTDWKSGKSNSYLKHISKIAEYLEVSTDYLLGNEKKSLSEKDKLIAEVVSMLNAKSDDEIIAVKDMLIAFAKLKGK